MLIKANVLIHLFLSYSKSIEHIYYIKLFTGCQIKFKIEKPQGRIKRIE